MNDQHINTYDAIYAVADQEQRDSMDAWKDALIETVRNLGDKGAKELIGALLVFFEGNHDAKR